MNLKAEIANDMSRATGISYNPSFGGKSILWAVRNASIIQSQKSHIWPHTKIHSPVLRQLGGLMRTDTWKNVGGLNKGGTGEREHTAAAARSHPLRLRPPLNILIDRIRGRQEPKENLSGNTKKAFVCNLALMNQLELRFLYHCLR